MTSYNERGGDATSLRELRCGNAQSRDKIMCKESTAVVQDTTVATESTSL